MANVGSGLAGQTYIGAGNGASGTYKPIGTNSGLSAHGVILSQGLGAFTSATPAAAGTILTSNGPGVDPTFQTPGSGFSWQIVTSAMNPITLVASTGYITKGVVGISFKLPAAASVGDTYKIVGYNALWTITQNANQKIILGILSSTVGVGGSFASSGVNDTIELVCVTANLEWITTDVTGNITIV